MTRIGINPARGKTTSYRPAEITVAMITYIPDLSGYFEGRLEVLKLVLASLRAHTTPAFDLMLFDNGSCSEVVEYLSQQQQAGQIDYLLLAHQNIGKIDALRILLPAAPGQIVAYSDDDILFYPGWLEAHLEILNAFPKAGMVSGCPVRLASLHAHQSLDRLANDPPPGITANRQRWIPDEWEIDWAGSTGRDPQKHLEDTRQIQDLVFRVRKSGEGEMCQAIASANHFQFVSPKNIILQALPPDWTGKMMGHMIELDETIDGLGYLRLSTLERYTRHLGNRLTAEILDEAAQMPELRRLYRRDPNVSTNTPADTGGRWRKKHWLLKFPGGRRLLSGLYHRLFKILYT